MILLSLLLVTLPAGTDDSLSPITRTAVGMYSSGEYRQVVELLEPIPEHSAVTGPDSIILIELYGSALVALGRESEAEQAFGRLLRIAPDHELDPWTYSPKIRAAFTAARSKTEPAPIPLTPLPAGVDTVYLRQPLSASLLVPGLTQLRQQRQGPGYTLLGLGIATVGGLAVSAVGYDSARREYLAATETEEISEHYAAANRWYRTRTVFISSAAVVWLYNLVDALR